MAPMFEARTARRAAIAIPPLSGVCAPKRCMGRRAVWSVVARVVRDELGALGIARRGYVLETGRIVLADRADRLRENDLVRRSYLGEA